MKGAPPRWSTQWIKRRKGSDRNRNFPETNTGGVQVPSLMDPNTGTEMYESAPIIDYLKQTYGP